MPTNEGHQPLMQPDVAETQSTLAHPAAAWPEPSKRRGLEDETHPSEDGLPKAWDQYQGKAMAKCDYLLSEYFAGRTDVAVISDVRVYYSEGPPHKDVVPNLFVVFGVPSYLREVYRIEEEGKAPDWVLEIAARQTYRKNVTSKKALYEELGVGEYFVYDPRGGMHKPRLRGWALRGGRFEELPDLRRPGVRRALESASLGLEFHFDGHDLRLWNPVTQGCLRTIREAEAILEAEARARRVAEQRAEAAEKRAESEAEARRSIEAQIAALRQQIGHS